MTPKSKLESITFAISTSIIFLFWSKTNSLISNSFSLIILSLATSLGVYRIILKTILYTVKKSKFVKKKLLGPEYMEGTWVGFYIGASDEERFFIEIFEQEIDSLIIRGKSFNKKMESHSNWTATNINIKSDIGKITYMYDIESRNDVSINNGIASLHFERKNQYSEPNKLYGYTVDSHLGKRVKTYEIKISEEFNINEDEAIKRAIELFRESKK